MAMDSVARSVSAPAIRVPRCLILFVLFLRAIASGSGDLSCDSSTNKERLGRCRFGARAEGEDLLKSTVDELKTWLVDNGAYGLDATGSKLDVDVLLGNELGVKAVKDVDEGDVLLKIPRKLIISEIEAGEEALPHEDAPWDVTIAAWILREKAKGLSSFFAPYIKSLPSSVPLPHLFDDQTIKEIDYQPVIEELGFWKSYVSSQFNLSYPSSLANATEDEFAWAMSIVWSRSAIIEDDSQKRSAPGKISQGLEKEIDGENYDEDDEEGEDEDEEEGNEFNIHSPWDNWGSSWARAEYGKRKMIVNDGSSDDDSADDGSKIASLHALIPFFDLFNHDFEPEAYWEFNSEGNEEGYVEIIANKTFSAGQKVHVSYFNFANDWFFLVYGFVPSFNPFEKLVLFSSVEEIMDQSEKLLGLPENKLSSDPDVIRKAREAFFVVEDQLQALDKEMPDENLSNYVFEEEAGLWIWNDAHVEPRVFASAAAIWLVHTHGNRSVDIDALVELSHLSIGLGHFPRNATCNKMAETATPDLMEASLFGLRLVHSKLSSIRSNFKTSLQEDEVALSELNQRLDDELAYSEANYKRDLSLRNAIKFRIGKKRLAERATARLNQKCPDQQSS